MSFFSWASQPQNLVALLISATAFFTVLGVLLPFIERDSFGSRLKRITDRREELTREQRERLAKRPTLRQHMTGRVGLMKAVLEKLNLKTMMEQPDLRKKLLMAGKRSNAALISFTFARISLPLVLATVTAVVAFGGKGATSPPVLKLIFILAAAGLGFYLPNILLSNQVTKRQQDIVSKLPDALDLMVICVESGMSLEAAFQKVAEEMAIDAPKLSEELALTHTELAFLSDRRAALENLAERTGLPTIKSMVMALIQAERYGTPIGQSLRVVAGENRDTRMSKAEEKAASLPAKLTVPMVMFFLPVVFMVLIGPTVIQAIRAFKGGG
jgi:tight adherence protein C